MYLVSPVTSKHKQKNSILPIMYVKDALSMYYIVDIIIRHDLKVFIHIYNTHTTVSYHKYLVLNQQSLKC